MKKIRKARTSKKQMRPGPATRAALLVDFLSCLYRRSGGQMTLLARQRSLGAPHLPKPAAEVIPRSQVCIHRGGQRSSPALRAGWGRRPRRPNNQYTLTRVSGMSPAIHPRELPATAGVAANHPATWKISRFAAKHSETECRTSQQEKVDHLCRTCGRRHFLVESRGKFIIEWGPADVPTSGNLRVRHFSPLCGKWAFRKALSPFSALLWIDITTF